MAKFNLTRIIIFLSGTIAMIFLVNYIVFAFTGPSGPPTSPSSSLPQPINVGSDPQTKTGDLTIKAFLYADDLRLGNWGGEVTNGGDIEVKNSAGTVTLFHLDGSTGNISWSGLLTGGSVPWARITGYPDEVGTLTNNKWCTADGSKINCTSDAPSVTQWLTSGSNIYYSAGNVGIGTESPGTKLDVQGGAINSGGTSVLNIYSNRTSAGGTSHTRDIGIYSKLNASANMGEAIAFYAANPSGSAAINYSAGLFIEDQIKASSKTNLLIGATQIPSGDFSIYNASDKKNYFSGSLGIGIQSPSQKLDVAGNINALTIGANEFCINPSGGCITSWPTVNYGSTAGTAAEGNKTIAINTGAGLLGGSTITIGAGGTINLSVSDISPINEIQNVISSQGLRRDASNNFGLIDTCSGSQVLKYIGGQWVCSNDTGYNSLANLQTAVNNDFHNLGGTDAVNDSVSSAELDGVCGINDKILKRISGAWQCADPPLGGIGDITGVSAGAGLLGGGISGDVTLSLDTGHNDGSAFDSRFVKKAGDTMTSSLTISVASDEKLRLTDDVARYYSFNVGDDGALALKDETGTVRFKIDDNGNVGIGTTNPGSKLTVDGSSPVVEIRSGGYLMLRPAANNWDMRLQAVGNQLDVLSGSALSAPIMSFLNGGNVVIGQSTPPIGWEPKLIIKGGGGEVMRIENGGDLKFCTNNNSSCNVGLYSDAADELIVGYGGKLRVGNLTVGGIGNCDTIDTDANGQLVCGVDEGIAAESDPTVQNWAKTSNPDIPGNLKVTGHILQGKTFFFTKTKYTGAFRESSPYGGYESVNGRCEAEVPGAELAGPPPPAGTPSSSGPAASFSNPMGYDRAWMMSPIVISNCNGWTSVLGSGKTATINFSGSLFIDADEVVKACDGSDGEYPILCVWNP